MDATTPFRRWFPAALVVAGCHSASTGTPDVWKNEGPPPVVRPQMRDVAWAIKPTETLVVMTTEAVNIPDDLMATYGQLNRLAQHGVSLINSSIIEPGYSGPLLELV